MAIVIGGAGGNTIAINGSIGSNNQYIRSTGSVTQWATEKLRAWINYDGTATGTNFDGVRGSFGISSVTDVSRGKTRLTFSTTMPDTNYAVLATIFPIAVGSDTVAIVKVQELTRTSVLIQTEDLNTVDTDVTSSCVAIFR